MWGSSIDKKNRHRQMFDKFNETIEIKQWYDIITWCNSNWVVKEQQIRKNFIRKYSNPIIESKCK